MNETTQTLRNGTSGGQMRVTEKEIYTVRTCHVFILSGPDGKRRPLVGWDSANAVEKETRNYEFLFSERRKNKINICAPSQRCGLSVDVDWEGCMQCNAQGDRTAYAEAQDVEDVALSV